MWQGNTVNVLKGTPQSTLQCLIYAQVRRSTETLQHESLMAQSKGPIRASLICPDEGIYSKQDPGDPDGAAAFWFGLCVRCCRSHCLLPFRGMRDQRQVSMLYVLYSVIIAGHYLNMNYCTFYITVIARLIILM